MVNTQTPLKHLIYSLLQHTHTPPSLPPLSHQPPACVAYDSPLAQAFPAPSVSLPSCTQHRHAIATMLSATSRCDTKWAMPLSASSPVLRPVHAASSAANAQPKTGHDAQHASSAKLCVPLHAHMHAPSWLYGAGFSPLCLAKGGACVCMRAWYAELWQGLVLFECRAVLWAVALAVAETVGGGGGRGLCGVWPNWSHICGWHCSRVAMFVLLCVQEER